MWIQVFGAWFFKIWFVIEMVGGNVCKFKCLVPLFLFPWSFVSLVVPSTVSSIESSWVVVQL